MTTPLPLPPDILHHARIITGMETMLGLPPGGPDNIETIIITVGQMEATINPMTAIQETPIAAVVILPHPMLHPMPHPMPHRLPHPPGLTGAITIPRPVVLGVRPLLIIKLIEIIADTVLLLSVQITSTARVPLPREFPGVDPLLVAPTAHLPPVVVPTAHLPPVAVPTAGGRPRAALPVEDPLPPVGGPHRHPPVGGRHRAPAADLPTLATTVTTDRLTATTRSPAAPVEGEGGTGDASHPRPLSPTGSPVLVAVATMTPAIIVGIPCLLRPWEEAMTGSPTSPLHPEGPGRTLATSTRPVVTGPIPAPPIAMARPLLVAPD